MPSGRHEYKRMSVSEFFRVPSMRLPEKQFTRNIAKHVADPLAPVGKLGPETLERVHRSISFALYGRGDTRGRKYAEIQDSIASRLNALYAEQEIERKAESIPWAFKKIEEKSEAAVPLSLLHGKRQLIYGVVSEAARFHGLEQKVVEAVDKAIENQSPKGTEWHGTIRVGAPNPLEKEPALRIEKFAGDIADYPPTHFPRPGRANKVDYRALLQEKIFEALAET